MKTKFDTKLFATIFLGWFLTFAIFGVIMLLTGALNTKLIIALSKVFFDWVLGVLAFGSVTFLIYRFTLSCMDKSLIRKFIKFIDRNDF